MQTLNIHTYIHTYASRFIVTRTRVVAANIAVHLAAAVEIVVPLVLLLLLTIAVSQQILCAATAVVVATSVFFYSISFIFYFICVVSTCAVAINVPCDNIYKYTY